MRRSLFTRFIIAYVIIAAVGFILMGTFGRDLVTGHFRKKLQEELYDQVNYIVTLTKSAPLSEIRELFGTGVADIVDVVTSLSDKDFADHTLTKEQRNLLSDARLQKKMNNKALYVKIADRIDNLNTLFGVPEAKRIPKAEHTREILIPMARMENAYHLVNILEELCFQIEHPKMYVDMSKQYRALCNANSRKCRESLETSSPPGSRFGSP